MTRNCKSLLSVLLLGLLLPVIGVTQSDREVRDRLNEVIAQSKYDYASSAKIPAANDKQKDLLKRFAAGLKRFFNGLGRALEKLFSLTGYAGIAVWIAFVVIPVILAAVLIVRIVRRSAAPPAAAAAFPTETTRLDSRTELDLAAVLIADGRFSEALSRIILALWFHYHRLEILKFDPSLTNREFSSRLGGRPEKESVARIVAVAEKAAYAGEDPGAGTCLGLLAEVREIVS